MNDSRKGHSESETAIPGPLDSNGWINRLGTRSPPAVMLSWASFLAFITIFGLLRGNGVLRVWFKIKLGDGIWDGRIPTLILVGSAGVLAWVITLKCRLRPGPFGPRLWVLGLALATTGLAVSQFGFRQWEVLAPAVDAASVACFAATLALLPRLLRIHPDNPWLQRVAPWSFVLVLLLLLPSLWLIAHKAEQFQREGFDAAIADMQAKTAEFSQCGETDACEAALFQEGKKRLEEVLGQAQWQESADLLGRSKEFAEAKDGLLDALALESSRRLQRQIDDDAKDWPNYGLSSMKLTEFNAILQLAVRMGKAGPDSKTFTAYQQLVGKIIDVLKQGYAKLDEPPVVYDDVTEGKEYGPWNPNASFSKESELVVRHHQALRRLYQEADGMVKNQATLDALHKAFIQNRGWPDYVNKLEQDWARHWLIPYLEPGKTVSTSLSGLLAMNVINDIPASDENSLSRLSLAKAEKAAKQDPYGNCDPKDTTEKDKTGNDKPIKTLRCRGYLAGDGIDPVLGVEIRLIYQLEDPGRPNRLFYFFPIPTGETDKAAFITRLQNISFNGNPVFKQILTRYNASPDKPCPLIEGQAKPCATIRYFSEKQKYILIYFPN